MYMLILLVISFVIGSIPFGYIVTRLVKDVDIRKHGSGNIGATNVVRVVGKKWGIVVFLLDLLKGAIAPLLMVSYGSQSSLAIILSAIVVVCGHNWTIFLKFKGGKGVAASLGAVIAMSFIFTHLWISLTAALLVWLFIFYGFRYVSLASLTASVVFCASSFILEVPIEIKLFSLILSGFIAIRHKANIKKLVRRTENRF
jgi:acyl phosphate:glycerol-3-phosphate acyltransferase